MNLDLSNSSTMASAEASRRYEPKNLTHSNIYIYIDIFSLYFYLTPFQRVKVFYNVLVVVTKVVNINRDMT